MDNIKAGRKIGGAEMFDFSTAPKKIRALLILSLIGTVVAIGTTFWVYSATRNVVQTVGKDTVPQIIAARNIKATLANAHSNAMNAMVTNEDLGGKFWSLYRKDLNTLTSQLIDASKNISYGEEERIPLYTIQSNIMAYEFTVGGAVATGAEISVDQFMEANRLMQQKILPSSSALDKANVSQLNTVYEGYTRNVENVMSLMRFIGFFIIVILIGTQIYLFRKTHRIFNAGLLMATMLLWGNLMYSTSALSTVKTDLHAAKQEAFDSLDALWNARAVAYNAKSLQSLYLLHEGTGIVQTADTINFNLSASRIVSDTKAALSGGSFEGFLSDALKNMTSPEERAAAETALKQWVKYVELDKQVRNLEYDSKHKEAIALSVGDGAGQSNHEFAKFDAALGEIISINQASFDSHINSAFKVLNVFPYITAAFLLSIITACILGLKARMDEYRVYKA
jgi:hypothetical protein